ncbi:hypothetical protein [Streptomyces sp. NPDC013455]|uniref:hypothetical protein n=1 Tax=Streptomyces sp. NPDC013455 TaxID=3155605 RepID=UPI0033C29913
MSALASAKRDRSSPISAATGRRRFRQQALLARATTTPVLVAQHPHPGTAGPTTGEPAQHGEDDSNDDLDDDTRPAAAAGFGLYDAYEEADKW